MKKYLNGFLIVEGNADKAFLSSFLNCEVIVLGGFAIPHGTISYIKNLSKTLTPILLTDPDEAGKVIRKRMNCLLDNLINIEVEFVNRKNYKKHGVAECDKKIILEQLEKYLSDKPLVIGNLVYADICEFIDRYGDDTKEKISTAFGLGTTNNKTMIRRLNYLKINKSDIIDVLENGN